MMTTVGGRRVIAQYVGAVLVPPPPPPAVDPDAQAFITAREAAFGSPVDPIVFDATNDLFKELKAEGLWDAIQHMALLAGARNMLEAGVMAKGTAFTNNNFVDADLNIKTGLLGDATTKWLNTNTLGEDYSITDTHASIWDTALALGTNGTKLGSQDDRISLQSRGGSRLFNVVPSFLTTQTTPFQMATLLPFSFEYGSAQIMRRRNGGTNVIGQGTGTQATGVVSIYRGGDTGNFADVAPRVAIYTLGVAANPILLENAFSTYMTAIGALP